MFSPVAWSARTLASCCRCLQRHFRHETQYSYRVLVLPHNRCCHCCIFTLAYVCIAAHAHRLPCSATIVPCSFNPLSPLRAFRFSTKGRSSSIRSFPAPLTSPPLPSNQHAQYSTCPTTATCCCCAAFGRVVWESSLFLDTITLTGRKSSGFKGSCRTLT